MQDRFLMRGALGILYEFMWANPYQPGLSYFQMPLVYHDADSGHVFARSSWDEDATETLVRFDLSEQGGITTVRLTHSGFASEGSRTRHQGWPQILSWLQGYVES